MALLKLTKTREEDLLRDSSSEQQEFFMQRPTVEKKPTEAPKMVSGFFKKFCSDKTMCFYSVSPDFRIVLNFFIFQPNNVVAHELLADGSRMNPKIENYLNAQRLLSGNAQAEQRLL